MEKRWYVWIDEIRGELLDPDPSKCISVLSRPALDPFLNRSDGTGWTPLLICDGETEADKIVKALVESDQAKTIFDLNLKIYRDPLSEQPPPYDALILDAVKRLEKLIGSRSWKLVRRTGKGFRSVPFWWLNLACRAREFRAVVSEPKPAAPAEAQGPWSKPDSAARLAKRLGISPRTFKRHIQDGKIPGRKLSDRLYVISLAYLGGNK